MEGTDGEMNKANGFQPYWHRWQPGRIVPAAAKKERDLSMPKRHQLVPESLVLKPRPGEREICFATARQGHQQRALGAGDAIRKEDAP